jgi:hypothetical protein
MDHGGRHHPHRDLDMHSIAAAVGPHAIRHQVTLCEGLEQTGEQAGRAPVGRRLCARITGPQQPAESRLKLATFPNTTAL